MSKPEDCARYLDGEPQNLPAAAADALEWLLWMRERRVFEQFWKDGKGEFRRFDQRSRDDAYVRLGGCVRELERLLPTGEAVYEETPSESDAEAVVIATSGPFTAEW